MAQLSRATWIAVAVLCGSCCICSGVARLFESPEARAQREAELQAQREARQKAAAEKQAAYEAKRAADKQKADEARAADEAKRQAYGHPLDAQRFARAHVRSRLTHPSTASFPLFGHDVTSPSPGQYHCTGKVSARNAFNLELTFSYSVDVTWNPETKSYTADNCTIVER